MKFRVYEFEADRDVTDEKEWYIDIDGDLLFMTTDIDFPLQIADSSKYYYKLEIEVF